MPEILSTPEVTKPLSEQELEQFAHICLTTTAEQSEPAIRSLFAACHYDISHAPFGGMAPNWPRLTAQNTTLRDVGPLESIYNPTQGSEFTSILAHDIAGWNRLYKMTFELSPHRPDDQTGIYQYDRHRAFTYVEPHAKDEVMTLVNSYAFPEVSLSELKTMPQLVDRLENGMPRQMQLLLIAMSLPGLKKSDPEMLRSDAFRASVLCNELSVSQQELSVIYNIMETVFPDKATEMRVAILQNEDLQSLLESDTLSTKDRLQSDPEALSEALRMIFSNFVLKGQESYLESWNNTCKLLGDTTLDEYFSQYERTILLHSLILKQLLDPHQISLRLHPDLVKYIDAGKLASECAAMLKMSLENPHDNTRSVSPTRAARKLENSLGIKLNHEVLRYSEYPYCKQIEAIIRYADEQSDIYKEAVDKRDQTHQYDPIMRQMIAQYAQLQNDESLRRLGQGFIYEDDPAWFDARSLRQQAVKSQLKVLESLISERANNI